MALTTDKENEARIIGVCLLGDTEALYQILDRLNPDDLYSPVYRKMFVAIVELAAKGKAVDAVSLAFKLKEKDELDECGGNMAIIQMAEKVISAANWQVSVEKQIEFSQRQKCLQLAQTLNSQAQNLSVSPEEAIEFTGNKLLEIGQRIHGEAYKSIHDGGQLMLDHIELVKQKGSSIDRIESFSSAVTRCLAGGYPAGLTLLAGREGEGKTTFIMNEAREWAAGGKWVCFASMEMTLKRLAFMYYAAVANLQVNDIENAYISDEQYKALEGKWSDSFDSRFYIDDEHGQTIDQIITRAKVRKAMGKLDVLIVDSLKAIYWKAQHYNADKIKAWEDVLNKLKAFADNEKVHVILLHHLNKALDKKRDKSPDHSDLQYIDGSIPDLVAFLFSAAKAYKLNQYENAIEFSVPRKNRGGPHGVREVLLFRPEVGKFADVDGLMRSAYFDMIADRERKQESAEMF